MESRFIDPEFFKFSASSLLGFRYWCADDWRTTRLPLQVWIPFWFLMLLSGLLLVLVWRVTRPRQLGQGFPVELAGGRGR